MESKSISIRTRLLTLAASILLAVTLTGCSDSIVSDMEQEHARMGAQLGQELRQYGFVPVSPPATVAFQSP